MRILVTGATGFVGRRLLERLAENGKRELYSLQRYVTGRDDLVPAQDVKTIATVVFSDLRDPAAVKSAVREIQPEVVFHLASISPVSYSYDHPNEVMDINLSGTINLAESCRREVSNFKHFLFASTSETYGNGPLPKREDTPQFPNSPYSVSKLSAEKYLFYMRQACRFPVTVLRAFNTYGRRDSADYLVERMIVQMLRGDVVRLGDPTPARDLLYIDDHVDAYLACLSSPEASIGEVFNVCVDPACKTHFPEERSSGASDYNSRTGGSKRAEKARKIDLKRRALVFQAIAMKPYKITETRERELLDFVLSKVSHDNEKAICDAMGWTPAKKPAGGMFHYDEIIKKQMAAVPASQILVWAHRLMIGEDELWYSFHSSAPPKHLHDVAGELKVPLTALAKRATMTKRDLAKLDAPKTKPLSAKLKRTIHKLHAKPEVKKAIARVKTATKARVKKG